MGNNPFPWASAAWQAERGWLDGEKAMPAALLSFKRADADGILTYAAMDMIRKMKE